MSLTVEQKPTYRRSVEFVSIAQGGFFCYEGELWKKKGDYGMLVRASRTMRFDQTDMVKFVDVDIDWTII